MKLRHPPPPRLTAWLEGTAPELDAHIENCHRCAEALENLGEPTSPVTAALELVLEPPGNLAPALRRGIARRERDRTDLSLLGDLLALPMHIARALTPKGSNDG
ncbi:MAG: hypothetical protein OEU32_07850 [Acidimicrobiia bacterium]|nr:hypothetical protein [Acidimicrobiia bacterium]